MQSEAELIAAGLSEDQRKPLIGAKADEEGVVFALSPAPLWADYHSMRDLGMLGDGCMLLPLGLAVREVLMRPPVR